MNSGESVWVVIYYGEDQETHGIFSTREKAEDYIAEIDWGASCQIEEWPLDTYNTRDHPAYICERRISDGEIVFSREYTQCRLPSDSEGEGHIFTYNIPASQYRSRISMEHAGRMSEELRLKYLASPEYAIQKEKIERIAQETAKALAALQAIREKGKWWAVEPTE